MKEERLTSWDYVNLPKIIRKNLNKIRIDNPFWKNQIYFKVLFGLDIKESVEYFKDPCMGDLVINYE